MKWPRWLQVATKMAPAIAEVLTQSDKRELLRERVQLAIAKLERRSDDAAVRKLAELRRSLRALELEDEIRRLRSGDVVVTPAPATLNAEEH